MKNVVSHFAAFSACGKYRYMLMREWDKNAPMLVWIMLNPSKAGAEQNDATVRRCMAYARAWGFGGITVVNLFAKIATYPVDLLGRGDPVGAENNDAILSVIQGRQVVCAWGNVADCFAFRVSEVHAILDSTKTNATCLGLTKFGNPSHPLRLSRKAERRRYEWSKP